MRRKVITTVVTFSTTTAAMKMERTAKESEFPGRLIPIPSEISAPVSYTHLTLPTKRIV